MYNTEKVAAADVPNSALDFLKPQFKGKIVTAYPADDDVTLWVFYHIVQKYGWSYMDKYMAAKPNFIQGHLGEQRSIGSGQNLVTFDSIYNITTVLKKQGMKVDTHFATEDATPFWPLAGAIFKGAPHPNAAKLFLTWLLEPTQQIATETWSGRSDVPPPAGYKPIFSYKVVDRLSGLSDQPDQSRRPAQALREIYRPGRQLRRRSLDERRQPILIPPQSPRRRGVGGLPARQRGKNPLDQRARRIGGQLDRDAITPALAFIGEVDGEHVIERRVIGMVEIDIGGVDPHPAFTAFGAADQRGFFDDVGAHDLPLRIHSAAMLAAEVAR